MSVGQGCRCEHIIDSCVSQGETHTHTHGVYNITRWGCRSQITTWFCCKYGYKTLMSLNLWMKTCYILPSPSCALRALYTQVIFNTFQFSLSIHQLQLSINEYFSSLCSYSTTPSNSIQIRSPINAIHYFQWVVLLICDFSCTVIYHKTHEVANPSVTQCVHKAHCKPKVFSVQLLEVNHQCGRIQVATEADFQMSKINLLFVSRVEKKLLLNVQILSSPLLCSSSSLDSICYDSSFYSLPD